MCKKIYIVIFMCVCFACNQKRKIETVESTESALYSINLDSIQTVDDFKMSSIFRKTKAILLEETDYAVIGNVYSMQVFDNYIFILDRHKAKKLFMFDKKGKYLRQIGSFGQGPGEYISISDFCLDTINREIYIHDASKRMLLKYNFDNGNFIQSTNIRHIGHCHYVTYFNNKIYANILYDENLLIEFDIETNMNKKFLNADKYNYGWNENYHTPYNFFISKLDSPKFVEHLMPTIISIDETGMYPYLTVESDDWVKKSDILSKEQLEKEELLDQYTLLIRKGRVFQIQNYMEYGDYIYFEYNRGRNIFFVVFNKVNKNVYQCNYRENLENDLFYKPGIKGKYQSFIFGTNKAVYSVFNPVKITLTEDDIALDMENRETVVEAIKRNEECFIILEYEFK